MLPRNHPDRIQRIGAADRDHLHFDLTAAPACEAHARFGQIQLSNASNWRLTIAATPRSRMPYASFRPPWRGTSACPNSSGSASTWAMPRGGRTRATR